MTLKNSERYSIYIHVRMCVSAVLWCSPFPLSTTVAVRQRGKADRVNDKKKKKKGWHTPAFGEPTHLPDEFRTDKAQVAQKPKQHDWGSSPDKNKNQNLNVLQCIYTFAISRCTHKRHRCVSAHLRDTQTEVQRNEADIFLQIQWSGYKNADRL